MAVTGGGASLPAELYKGSADSILPANFSYAVTGSGTGKNAFLTNNSSLFGTTGTVHYAGSDSVLSGSELTTYNSNYNGTYRSADPDPVGSHLGHRALSQGRQHHAQPDQRPTLRRLLRRQDHLGSTAGHHRQHADPHRLSHR